VNTVLCTCSECQPTAVLACIELVTVVTNIVLVIRLTGQGKENIHRVNTLSSNSAFSASRRNVPGADNIVRWVVDEITLVLTLTANTTDNTPCKCAWTHGFHCRGGGLLQKQVRVETKPLKSQDVHEVLVEPWQDGLLAPSLHCQTSC